MPGLVLVLDNMTQDLELRLFILLNDSVKWVHAYAQLFLNILKKDYVL